MSSVPVWVVAVMAASMTVFSFALAYMFGVYKQRRAEGLWESCRPMLDWRFSRGSGKPTFSYVTTWKNDEWFVPHGQNIVKFYKEKEFFGNTPDNMHVDEFWETGRFIHRGRTEFEELFRIKAGVLRSELEHFRELSGMFQDMAESHRHDPNTAIDKQIEQLRKISFMQPLPINKPGQKPGVRK